MIGLDINIELPARCPLAVLARVVNLQGVVLHPDLVQSITYSVTDVETGLAVTGHSAVSVSPGAVLSAALNPGDVAWGGEDHIGPNFRHVVGAGAQPAFPLGERTYRLEYETTLIDETTIPLPIVTVRTRTVYRYEG